MSEQDKEVPAESTAESKTEDASKAVAQFARYTSPVMLAMLVSGGHNMPLAAASLPP